MSFGSAIRKRDGGNRLEFDAGAKLDFGGMVHLFDDFLGDALSAEWNGAAGTDPQAVAPAVNVQAGGVVRLTAGDAGTGVAADGSVLNRELVFYPNKGGLTLEARVKLSAITDVILNVGFTDTKALELPFEIGASDALTSNATDAACFVFDTGADTDAWHCAGVANDVDAADPPTAAGSAPVAGTWVVLRIEISKTGVADFYVNDQHVAQLAAAVTASVALTPVVAICSDTTTAVSVDVDYIWVRVDR